MFYLPIYPQVPLAAAAFILTGVGASDTLGVQPKPVRGSVSASPEILSALNAMLLWLRADTNSQPTSVQVPANPAFRQHVCQWLLAKTNRDASPFSVCP